MTENKKEKTKSNEKKPVNRELEWILKPCYMYKEEYKECKSIKGRFQQYFVFGQSLDCSQWRIDYDNCRQWKKTNSDEAFEALLASEKKRRLERLRPHFANDTWPKRDKPPENWNAPLPEWMAERNEGTLLAIKQTAMKSGQSVNDLDVDLPLCTIL